MPYEDEPVPLLEETCDAIKSLEDETAPFFEEICDAINRCGCQHLISTLLFVT
jgi:hypothetical protein